MDSLANPARAALGNLVPATRRRRAGARRTAALRALCAVALLAAAPAGAQQAPAPRPPAAMPATGGTAATAGAPDCARWPGSAYDDAAGACGCPAGTWWNRRGDACLPREHAAAEFCASAWPASTALFDTAGGFRCVCPPNLVWNAEAAACGPVTLPAGTEDCAAEWPGTVPVLSPSAGEFACRCPAALRWDEAAHGCVASAPVVRVSDAFLAPGVPPVPPPIAVPAPGAEAPGAGAPMGSPPANVAVLGASMPATAPDSAAQRSLPPAAVGAAAPLPAASGNARCDSLLAEIRGRAEAGQADLADQLGMQAAVAGCDPKAIADAARTKRGSR